MVRHLKQYEYLLLRRWPVEHAKLAKILCLDQIPILIDLFRSLVTCIDQTKTEQGYRGMAEAVLAWLTDNSSANLKVNKRYKFKKIITVIIYFKKSLKILIYNVPVVCTLFEYV